MYTLYKHINKINGKVYIGIINQPPERRFRNGAGYKNSTLFYRAIQKYGWDNFDHIILESNIPEDQVSQKEIAAIHLHRSSDPTYGYNLQLGGLQGTGSQSESTKQKLSEIFSKPIVIMNYITLEREAFKSMKEFAEKYSLKVGSVSKVLSGESKRVDRFLCATGNDIKIFDSESFQKTLRNFRNNAVVGISIDDLSLSYHPTMSDAAKFANVYRCRVSMALKNKNIAHCGGYIWVRLDKFNGIDQNIYSEIEKRKKNSR